MAYHSQIECNRQFGDCNMAWMPLKNPSNIRGNAPSLGDEQDIVDDIISFFRANVFFQSYTMDTNVDKLYVYGTLYLAECLKQIHRCKNKKQAKSELYTLAVQNVSREMPGDPKFPLNAFIRAPSKSKDKADLTTYLTQLRQIIGERIIEKCYDDETSGPSKWWMMFNKNRFIGKTLTGRV